MAKSTRKNKVCIAFNDEEYKLVQKYIEKYRIKSTSGTMREIVIRAFLKQLDDDRPTLFD